MARTDGRLEAGSKLRVSARAWNRAQDAADIVLGARPGFDATGPAGGKPSYTWIYGQALEDTPQWGAVEIYEQPGAWANPQLIQTDGASWKVRRPTSDDVAFGIAVEPIAAGGVGRIAVAGVVPAICDPGTGKATAHRAYVRARQGTFLLHSAAAGTSRALVISSSLNPDPGDSSWNAITPIGAPGQIYKSAVLVRLDSQLLELRAEFSGRWDKGATKSVHIVVDGTMTNVESVQAKNYVATINAGDESNKRRCTIALLNNEWQLTSYDLTTEPSYTALRRQYLSHDTSGCVTWSEAFIRARASGPWAFGATRNLQFYRDGVLDNETVSAKNNLVGINAPSAGANVAYDVFLAYIDNEWLLVGFDYRKLSGYSEGQNRVLVVGSSGLEFLSMPPRAMLYVNDSGGIEFLGPPSFDGSGGQFGGSGGQYVLAFSLGTQGPVWRRIDPNALL